MKGILWLIPLLFLTVSSTHLGVSTSSFQIEGARSDRGDSIWDGFHKIEDGSNADVACDHYHRWEQDLDLIEWVGAKVYRFSFSWPRIFPNGDRSVVHQDGVDFYHRVLDGLLARNITPLVTLSHWDIPQTLQDRYGGWEDDRILDDFVDYAQFCFKEYGDKVSHWLTLNEPLTVVQLGYGNGYHAPGKSEPSRLVYEVAHRMIRAHARVYHSVLDHNTTKISIALNSDFIQPMNPQDPEDVAAAQRGLLWRMGWFADPFFFNRYPDEMRARCGDRLPLFAEDVNGTMDFFALNHYTTLEATSQYNQDYTLFQDPQVRYRFPPGSPGSASAWLHDYPSGIYGMIRWIHDRYPVQDMELVVTESGVSTYPGQLEDQARIDYLSGYIPQALRAATDLRLNLSAYCIWSILDNFEWAAGYQERYGLFDVDFQSLERTPKKSAYWLRDHLVSLGLTR